MIIVTTFLIEGQNNLENKIPIFYQLHGQLLLLPENIPNLYPKLLHPVHGTE